ncbi:hypothetical protein M427DRAFT_64012 [Gonapodya prolifera JEL478]|uniref:Ribosome biogenesis protein SLX9 n=1 Tax=Gonapodya prolifera (strain JEL478) TaxID=1344416 RepID=A0A138ZYC3_GONPJ|nr:hypothetical protein M427DRAFT_64012 [Gonapodya prolifera JEL478]|eukprot:KXS09497.1 hypothetical protein M427DRAFT_64012 [Gonapodya prolifera JEL478]
MPKAPRSRQKVSRKVNTTSQPPPERDVVTFDEEEAEDTEATWDTTESIVGSDDAEAIEATMTKDEKRRLKHLRWMQKLALSHHTHTAKPAKTRKEPKPKPLDLGPLHLSLLDAELEQDQRDEERTKAKQIAETRKRNKPLSKENRKKVGMAEMIRHQQVLALGAFRENPMGAIGVHVKNTV